MKKIPLNPSLQKEEMPKAKYLKNSIKNAISLFESMELNKKQLIDFGILEKNIETAEICTRCHADIFFSRRAQISETGNLVQVL